MASPATYTRCKSAHAAILDERSNALEGSTTAISGMLIDVAGLSHHAVVGTRLNLHSRAGLVGMAEVIGFQPDIARVMAFSTMEGLGPGCMATMGTANLLNTCGLAVSNEWVGRVLDPFGHPIDQKGVLPLGFIRRNTRSCAPQATQRARLGARINLGVRAVNLFATCRAGQRLGLFAGAGVGKSTLLSMLARHAACDRIVVCLLGERGREVREFIEDSLGPNGLARSVVVVATSDQPPLMRREAAYTAITIAEDFRDQGMNVLLLMDSVTRFCHALREIALSVGEPPAARGYPPSVFAELPRLLERVGPGFDINGTAGQITGLFTVLVDEDDQNDPIADAVRGILDGHVMLDRQIADRGRYPAIDVLRSLSRAVPGCNTEEENEITRRARSALVLSEEMAELVRLGAYQAGTDSEIDNAMRISKKIETLLNQGRDENNDIEGSFFQLRSIITGNIA